MTMAGGSGGLSFGDYPFSSLERRCDRLACSTLWSIAVSAVHPLEFHHASLGRSIHAHARGTSIISRIHRAWRVTPARRRKRLPFVRSNAKGFSPAPHPDQGPIRITIDPMGRHLTRWTLALLHKAVAWAFERIRSTKRVEEGARNHPRLDTIGLVVLVVRRRKANPVDSGSRRGRETSTPRREHQRHSVKGSRSYAVQKRRSRAAVVAGAHARHRDPHDEQPESGAGRCLPREPRDGCARARSNESRQFHRLHCRSPESGASRDRDRFGWSLLIVGP